MKRVLILSVLLVLIGQSAWANAGFSKRTRQLHDVYCKKCHTAVLYLTKRKLTTRDQVQEKVFSYQDQFTMKPKEWEEMVDYLWFDYYSQPLPDE